MLFDPSAGAPGSTLALFLDLSSDDLTITDWSVDAAATTVHRQDLSFVGRWLPSLPGGQYNLQARVPQLQEVAQVLLEKVEAPGVWKNGVAEQVAAVVNKLADQLRRGGVTAEGDGMNEVRKLAEMATVHFAARQQVSLPEARDQLHLQRFALKKAATLDLPVSGAQYAAVIHDDTLILPSLHKKENLRNGLLYSLLGLDRDPSDSAKEPPRLPLYIEIPGHGTVTSYEWAYRAIMEYARWDGGEVESFADLIALKDIEQQQFVGAMKTRVRLLDLMPNLIERWQDTERKSEAVPPQALCHYPRLNPSGATAAGPGELSLDGIVAYYSQFRDEAAAVCEKFGDYDWFRGGCQVADSQDRTAVIQERVQSSGGVFVIDDHLWVPSALLEVVKTLPPREAMSVCERLVAQLRTVEGERYYCFSPYGIEQEVKTRKQLVWVVAKPVLELITTYAKDDTVDDGAWKLLSETIALMKSCPKRQAKDKERIRDAQGRLEPLVERMMRHYLSGQCAHDGGDGVQFRPEVASFGQSILETYQAVCRAIEAETPLSVGTGPIESVAHIVDLDSEKEAQFWPRLNERIAAFRGLPAMIQSWEGVEDSGLQGEKEGILAFLRVKQEEVEAVKITLGDYLWYRAGCPLGEDEQMKTHPVARRTVQNLGIFGDSSFVWIPKAYFNHLKKNPERIKKLIDAFTGSEVARGCFVGKAEEPVEMLEGSQFIKLLGMQACGNVNVTAEMSADTILPNSQLLRGAVQLLRTIPSIEDGETSLASLIELRDGIAKVLIKKCEVNAGASEKPEATASKKEELSHLTGEPRFQWLVKDARYYVGSSAFPWERFGDDVTEEERERLRQHFFENLCLIRKDGVLTVPPVTVALHRSSE